MSNVQLFSTSLSDCNKWNLMFLSICFHIAAGRSVNDCSRRTIKRLWINFTHIGWKNDFLKILTIPESAAVDHDLWILYFD